MAFSETLAARVRMLLASRAATEKTMFGGLGFLLNGNMACGVHGEELIVCVAPERTEDALAKPHTRAFEPTGRPARGCILVTPPGLRNDKTLSGWVRTGADFASTLPRRK